MRVKFSIFVALLMAATGLGLGATGAGAVTAADLQSTVTGEPLEVSPVGGIALYSVTFTNNGLAPVLAQLTDETDGGTFEPGLSDIGTCTVEQTAPPVINCDRVLSPGVSVQIEVAVRTPSMGTTLRNTATALVDPSVATTVIDDKPGNNSEYVDTKVFNNPDSSSALVKQGETLEFGGNKVKVTSASDGVSPALKGIQITLNKAFGNGDVCGTTYCGDGLHLGYGTDPDRQGMLQVELNFLTDPCRGKGAAKCSAIYERKIKNGFPTVTEVPPCLTTPDLKKTCVISVGKVGPYFRHLVRQYSVDPQLLQAGTLEL